MPIARLFVLGLALAALVGCAGGGGGTYPVSGKVVFADGKPVSGGWITFEPVDDKTGQLAAGPITDGSFTLQTTDKLAGAKPGKYRVTIAPPEEDSGGEGEEGVAPPATIDPKFQSSDTSGLEAEVKPQSNDFTFTVTPPTGKKQQRGK